MFHHLLVPLDGSGLSESILPIAARIARREGAALTLVHVVEKHAPSEKHRDRHLVTRAEAESYLAETVRLPVLEGLRVQTHVHEAEVRDVARAILEHTSELAPDLVIMSTHGVGGARRLLFGTIAQQVIAQGATPVLLARPESATSAATGREWTTIVAPVDGDPTHEKAIPVAADLARAFACTLHLLMVTPRLGHLSGFQHAASTLLPGATRLKLEMESASAAAYVAERARGIAASGVKTSAEAARGEPWRAIVRTARRIPADLVVMATHGRAGTKAFYEGSVAAQVVNRSRVPLLLVPLRDSAG